MEAKIHCPSCGEVVVLYIDTHVRRASHVEDCDVCCRPMQVDVRVAGGGNLEVSVKRLED